MRALFYTRIANDGLAKVLEMEVPHPLDTLVVPRKQEATAHVDGEPLKESELHESVFRLLGVMRRTGEAVYVLEHET